MHEDPDMLRDLRAPSVANGGVFRRDEALMVFDANAAVKANADNFADLTLPDRLLDLIRRKPSPEVSWKQVRAAWVAQMRKLSGETELAALNDRMEKLLRARVGDHVNLPWLAHEVSFRSLVPVVLDGFSEKDKALMTVDALTKLDRLMRPPKADPPLWRTPRLVVIGVRAGFVIRRQLRRRASGRAPARTDLTQAIITELMAPLGMDRTLHAIAGVFTAIAGPPGAAAANLMYALVKHPDWAERLRAEFAEVSLAEMYRTGTRCAPLAHRFVKEVLRMWTSPTMINKGVRGPIRVGEHELDVGQQFVVSAAMVHHDRRYWADPDVFDPDRWLPDAATGPAGGQHYVPFGWAPTSCVGAGLGMIQLVLLCRLLCTTFRIEVTNPSALRMAVVSVSLPMDFDGRIQFRRPANGVQLPVPRSSGPGGHQ